MGCSGDPADGMEQMTTHELRLSLGTHQYGVTRALPDGFESYDHSAAIAKIMQIQGYMTYWNTDKTPSDGWDAVPCTFTHTTSGTDDVWTSRVTLKTLESGESIPDDRETYYLYGYMPKGNESSGVNIAPNGDSYAAGAVLTFTGLNTVIAEDLCVIVGVQGYGKSSTTVPDMSSRLGKFNYNPETEGNSIFLLVDHLYAGLKFNMTLDVDYAKLRDIRVKSVKLTPEDGDNNVIQTVDAEVTIAANNQNSMSFVFQNPVSGKTPQSAVLYDGEGLSLSSTAKQAFMACVWPGTNTSVNTKFTLETTYDVYDLKDNLIRKDQTVRNAISLEYNLAAGQLHTVNMRVTPTYLYVLSDPDLNNPTFQLE